MATLRINSSASCVASCRTARPSRGVVVVKASRQEAASSGRREVLGALALTSAAALLGAPAPAKAFLGIGEDGNLQQSYSDRTTAILTEVRSTLDLPKDDPSKEDKVASLRKDINSWVATYRREPKVSGKPSYSNTYSVLNALAGHYNSFGATAPIPKKRLDRIVKELDDATLFLSRGR